MISSPWSHHYLSRCERCGQLWQVVERESGMNMKQVKDDKSQLIWHTMTTCEKCERDEE